MRTLVAADLEIEQHKGFKVVILTQIRSFDALGSGLSTLLRETLVKPS